MSIDQIISHITITAASHGLVVVSAEQSRLSVSRYIKVAHADGLGFDGGKSARRAFCAATRMPFPRDTSFCVRISDHHGTGDGSTVHHSIRLDRDVAADLAQADLALAMLAALPHPHHA